MDFNLEAMARAAEAMGNVAAAADRAKHAVESLHAAIKALQRGDGVSPPLAVGETRVGTVESATAAYTGAAGAVVVGKWGTTAPAAASKTGDVEVSPGVFKRSTGKMATGPDGNPVELATYYSPTRDAEAQRLTKLTGVPLVVDVNSGEIVSAGGVIDNSPVSTAPVGVVTEGSLPGK